MCFALQDSPSWSDVAGYELSGVATPPRPDQGGYAGHLRERTMESMRYPVHSPTAISGRDRSGELFGLVGLGGDTSLTPIDSAKPPQPSIGRRRRRERGEASPLCERTCPSFLENISNSPKKTPTKSPPLTPSRVKCAFILFYFISTSARVEFGCVANLSALFSSAAYPGQNIWIWITPPSPQHLCVDRDVFSSTRRFERKPRPSARKRMMGT